MDESTIGTLKRCGKCGTSKPTVRFEKKLKRNGTHGGRAAICLECAAAFRAEQFRRDTLVANGVWECADCKQTKPVCDFHPSRQAKRGLCAYCKECQTRRIRKKNTVVAVHRRKLAELREQGLRICASCKATKPLGAFYAHGANYSSYCKSCDLQQQHERSATPEHRAKRMEHYRRPHVQAKAKARRSAYWKDPANREKIAARKAVYKAIKRGKLVRGPCMECGKPNADAHHHNGYGREHRFDIEWLCRSCHLRLHRSPGREEPAPTHHQS